jgi:CelD/BcsL family acetyltransferase involved in cellulose biosynthesis
MRLDGKPIAVNLCTRTGNTLWMLKITYADDLQEHSPGNLILLYLLDHFAEVPDIEYISFITGGEWTWRWGPEKQPVLFCSLFNKSLLGIAGAALEHARDKLRRVKRQLKSALKAPPKSSDRQEDAT